MSTRDKEVMQEHFWELLFVIELFAFAFFLLVI